MYILDSTMPRLSQLRDKGARRCPPTPLPKAVPARPSRLPVSTQNYVRARLCLHPAQAQADAKAAEAKAAAAVKAAEQRTSQAEAAAKAADFRATKGVKTLEGMEQENRWGRQHGLRAARLGVTAVICGCHCSLVWRCVGMKV